MDWSEVGALGNLLGAIGVVVSLVYLGAQIKHQIREARVTAVHELTENFRGFLMALAENEQLGDIWVRGIYDFPGLAPVERLRLSSALGNAFRIFDTLYNYYNEGIIDAQSWVTLEAPVNDLLAYPGIQTWWPTRKHWYSEAYQRRIDDKIAHSKGPSMYGEQTPR